MRNIAILGMALVVLATAGSVNAHPPERIDLEFDLATHILLVAARHAVADSSRHYVDRIEVDLNGKKIIDQKFGLQTDSRGQLATYMIIDAQAGDEIAVSVRCNISGTKKAKMIVAEQSQQREESPPEDR